MSGENEYRNDLLTLYMALLNQNPPKQNGAKDAYGRMQYDLSYDQLTKLAEQFKWLIGARYDRTPNANSYMDTYDTFFAPTGSIGRTLNDNEKYLLSQYIKYGGLQ